MIEFMLLAAAATLGVAGAPQGATSPAPQSREPVEFPLDAGGGGGGAQAGGLWLKEVCAKTAQTEETCFAYVFGVIDSLTVWDRELKTTTSICVVGNTFGKVIAGVRSYLESLPDEQADNDFAPVLIRRAMEAKFDCVPR